MIIIVSIYLNGRCFLFVLIVIWEKSYISWYRSNILVLSFSMFSKILICYLVYSIFENELYYSLFKLGTKDIEILNNDFKKAYKNYLENQIKSVFLLKILAN